MSKTKKTTTANRQTLKQAEKQTEKEFLALYPSAAVKAATKLVKEMGSIEVDAARDMFLYGYSFAHEDRAKRAKALLIRAEQSVEWIDDTLDDDDCEVVEVDRDVLFNLKNTLSNLVRAINVNDAPSYEDDDDEPRIVDDKPTMTDAGKDVVIRSLKDTITGLEAQNNTLNRLFDLMLSKILVSKESF